MGMAAPQSLIDYCQGFQCCQGFQPASELYMGAGAARGGIHQGAVLALLSAATGQEWLLRLRSSGQR
jgi:hypothetical protein